jgi:uncharacterized phage protein (TIGR01671 family)
MREIRFRAWDTHLGVMLHWDGCRFVKRENVKNGDRIIACSWDFAESKFELEQYTGIEDNNGTEIYEGDQFKHGDTLLTVSWHKYQGRWHAVGGMYRICGHKFCLYEIIGNIHEERL